MTLYSPKVDAMRKFPILAVMLLFATACVANTRPYKDAIVINVSETDISGAARSDKNVMHYTVETADMLYFLDYAYSPAGHNNNHPPNLAISVPVKMAVEGKSAYILDSTGAEVKLHVTKKTKK